MSSMPGLPYGPGQSIYGAAGAQIANSIPPEAWDRFKRIITELYHESTLTLEGIREYMRQTHLFEASLKQWKQQLRTWGLGRYLNKDYAAHILRLYKQAADQGITRRVFFYGKWKSRQDIGLYLRKSKPPRTANDLLEQLPENEPVPSCITYTTVTQLSPRGRSSRTSFVSTPYSRPLSSPRPVLMDSSPLTGPASGCTSWTSPQSSPGWSLIDQHDASENLAPLSVDLLPPLDEDLDAESEDDVFSGALLLESLEQVATHFQTLAINASEVDPSSALGLLQPLVAPNGTQAKCSDYLHGTLSVTPPQLWMESTIGHVKWDVLPEALQTILLQKHNCTLLKTEAYKTSFLLNCLQECIFRNQGQAHGAGSPLRSAVLSYKEILHNDLEECLSVLSNLTALLESYGQRILARDILLLMARTLQERAQETGSVEMDPLYETVMFMCQTQLPEYGASGIYDRVHLRMVQQKLSEDFGNMSKLTLIARYNVAWAELEHRDYPQARRLLIDLKPSTETVFGRWHLQSISCAATLARAHLRCGEFESANILVEETVVPRIEKVFSKSHPYLWEARYRQACFMKIASDEELDPGLQQRLKSDAESILREVLLWRLTILGSNNPRTHFAFRMLKEVLEKEGKTNEANNLHNWCTTTCQPERQRLWGHRFVLTTS